jgi:hypothetical protein
MQRIDPDGSGARPFLKRLAICAAVLVITFLAAPNALGQFVIPANAVAYGRTYSEWSGAWQQWSLSIPISRNPLFDNGDCRVGQSGRVWFLGGKFCSIDNPNCGTTKVVRSCTVPFGKALYIAVINSEYSVLEMNDTKAQIADMRSYCSCGHRRRHKCEFRSGRRQHPFPEKEFPGAIDGFSLHPSG